jgi:3-deoxy-7-phosphoheptulonate synthase
MQKTDDLRIVSTMPLTTPDQLKAELPVDEGSAAVVLGARAAIADIVLGRDPRLLVVVGPCSIHDPRAAVEYADRLSACAGRYADELLLCMRGYFEKPRTSIGWKGFVNDPHLDGSCDVAYGLRAARSLLLELAARGLPIANEALDPVIPQYLADLIAWSAVGARTTESQTHREMASGLSMPVGFKNGTDGTLDIAINAMHAASTPHSFLGIDGMGRVSVVRTGGNPHAHLVLRGGSGGPNYSRSAIQKAAEKLRATGQNPRVLVDCSHGNSQKDYTRQAVVAADLAEQIAVGGDSILGVMIESHLVAGRQELTPGQPLCYGQSITDACVDFATTETILDDLARGVRTRARRAA